MMWSARRTAQTREGRLRCLQPVEGLEVDQLSLHAAEDAAGVAGRAGRGMLLVIDRNILGLSVVLRVHWRRYGFCFGLHDGGFRESGLRCRSEPTGVLRTI